MDKKELRKANGDVFFEVWRSPDNSFLVVNWIGIQSLETIVMGGNHILMMLRQKPCEGLVNSNRELIGPWDVAVNWLNYKWAPQAKLIGLKYFAHVLSPGIYGQRPFKQLEQGLAKNLEVRSFSDEEEAINWLLIKINKVL